MSGKRIGAIGAPVALPAGIVLPMGSEILPSPPVQPPEAPQVIPEGISGDTEVYLRDFKCPGSTATDVKELVVCGTTKAWRALDVYVSTSFPGGAPPLNLTISVFAITRGVRQLVAVGRFQNLGRPGPQTHTQRVVAVRAPLAEKFEITALNDGAEHTFQIAVIGMNDAGAGEDDTALCGAIRWQSVTAGPILFPAWGFAGGWYHGVELLGLNAANSGAAVYLQIHEITNAIPALAIPLWSFPLATNTGLNLSWRDLKQIGVNFDQETQGNRLTGIGIGFSSSASIYIAAATANVAALAR